MNYSRKQLYALGEPFGESATRLKPGGRVYGGGGGGSSTPEKTTQIAELPEWARGYAKDTLAKGAALTDLDKNPYQQYGGERIAGFQPMQQQSFQRAANMGTSSQLDTASGLAGLAGSRAMGTDYQGGQFQGGQFGNQQAQQYMNPYMQNVVDVQQREAQRQADIAGTQRGAQAVQAGAFGGSRQAIMDAEAARNLAMQKGDIQAQGSNAAFTNAQQQFNQDMSRGLQAQQMGEQSRQYGAGLGMQGLQTALQSAGQLGVLGGQQFQQGMDITKLQNQMGAQQQQQAQRPMDMAYQDFLNQQNYPYKQLGFMSDMIRGLPLGQQSTSSIYEQGPGMTQTLAGLGGAAYGFGRSGLFGKEGGLMTSYAEGGDVEEYADGGVTSDQNVESILGKLSDQQLAQAKEAALNRQDAAQAQMIDAEMAERASIRSGLGSAFDQIPPEQQEEMMAGGGIVAFGNGGDTYRKQFKGSLDTLTGMKPPEPQTAEELERGAMNRLPMLERMMGPDATIPFAEELKEKREKLPEQMEKDQGLAIAAASLGLLARGKKRGESRKQQLISGLGEAGLSFTGEVSRLKKENREADEKIRQSQLLIATAQQQRKEGMAGKALASEEKADDKRQDAFKTKMAIQKDATQLLANQAITEAQGENSLKVAGVQAGTQLQAAKINKEAGATADRQIAALAADIKEKNPKMSPAEINARATKEFLNLSGRYPGDVKAANAANELDAKFEARVDKALESNMPYLKAVQKGNTEEAARIRQGVTAELRASTSQAAPQAAPQAASGAKPSLQMFMDAARKANPGVSDADLAAYYNQKYGK
jgi:predicted HD phosphohydrolase